MTWLENEHNKEARNDQHEKKDNLPVPGLLLVLFSFIKLMDSILHMNRSLLHIEVNSIQERALIDHHGLKVLEDIGELKY